MDFQSAPDRGSRSFAFRLQHALSAHATCGCPYIIPCRGTPCECPLLWRASFATEISGTFHPEFDGEARELRDFSDRIKVWRLLSPLWRLRKQAIALLFAYLPLRRNNIFWKNPRSLPCFFAKTMQWRSRRLASEPDCPSLRRRGKHSTAQAPSGKGTRRDARILDIELFPFRDGFERLLPARRLLRSRVSAEQNSQLETGFIAQIAFRAVAQQADSAF